MRVLIQRVIFSRAIGLCFLGILPALYNKRLPCRAKIKSPALCARRNLLDLQNSQFLAMPALAAIVLAPLLLEYDHLGAARLLHDLRRHRRARDHRCADFGASPPIASTWSSDISAPTSPTRRSTVIWSPTPTRYCFPPVFTIANMLDRTNLIIGLSWPCQRTCRRSFLDATDSWQSLQPSEMH